MQPSVLLTFLLADVRGYTAYTRDHGDEAAALFSEWFLSLCRDVLAQYGGDSFGSAGDQALTAFVSARQALRASVALQARLASEQEAHPELPLRAGIGLDVGEAVRVGDDYRGGAINLAARLCSIAGPGEIFASEAVIHLATKTEGVAFIDRGEVTLKGLADPVRVIQVAPEGVKLGDLPPLQPILVTHPTNLPDEPTPFIGREGQIAEIVELLQQPGVRLVTLTGPGGTGKTRLALQVGNTLLYNFADGVFFVSLASLSDPGLVVSAIAETLGVKESGERSLLEVLAGFLEDKQLLLVLDNFEHLLGASSVVSSLLERCRRLHVLVTSRIPLHLSREHEYPVPPLAVPDPTRLPDPAALSQYEAVALFIERAAAVRPGFAVTNDNAPAVAEICARLDGLPLAIELAAARTKLFSPQAMLQRLSGRLKLLTGGAVDRPSRHQTLRGTIDWSYSLLSPEEQTLFARLSVFAGGCTFEAAEAVGNSDEKLDILEGISGLVEKSLLRQEGEDEPRFAMLETIREYATERLEASGDAHEVQRQHTSYYLQFAEEAWQHRNGPDQVLWFGRLAAEQDNLRAVLRRALDARDAETALRLCNAIWFFWYIRGYFKEGLRWLEEALARSEGADTMLRAIALRGAGALADDLGDYQRGVTLLEESLALTRQLDDPRQLIVALNSLALGLMHLEELDRAEALLEERLEIAHRIDSGDTVAITLHNLALVARQRADLARAMELMEESLALSRRTGPLSGVGNTLLELGKISAAMGAQHRALRQFTESLQLARDVEDGVVVTGCLEGLAGLAVDVGEFDRAVRLYAAAARRREQMGAAMLPRDQATFEQHLQAARTGLDETRWAALWREGQTMTLDEAIDYALAVSPA